MRVPPALPEARLEDSTLLAEDRHDSTGVETLLYTKQPTTESQSCSFQVCVWNTLEVGGVWSGLFNSLEEMLRDGMSAME